MFHIFETLLRLDIALKRRNERTNEKKHKIQTEKKTNAIDDAPTLVPWNAWPFLRPTLFRQLLSHYQHK